MKVLRCEMCGNTGLVKKDGVYVCEACGTKYTLEEAKKMLVDGAVAIKGAVKIDKATDEQNLIILARRAYKANEYDKAKELYARAAEINPNDWESTFYATYCEKRYVWACKDALTLSLNLIKNTIKNKSDQKKAIFTIVDSVFAESDTYKSWEVRDNDQGAGHLYSWLEILTNCLCDNVSAIDDSYNIAIRKGIIERATKRLNYIMGYSYYYDTCYPIYKWIQENIAKVRKYEPDYTPKEKANVPVAPIPQKETLADKFCGLENVIILAVAAVVVLVSIIMTIISALS